MSLDDLGFLLACVCKPPHCGSEWEYALSLFGKSWIIGRRR